MESIRITIQLSDGSEVEAIAIKPTSLGQGDDLSHPIFVPVKPGQPYVMIDTTKQATRPVAKRRGQGKPSGTTGGES